MLMIIASHLDDYVVTTKKNYESYIQNARQMHYFPKSNWTPEKIIEHLCKYYGYEVEDFRII